ncbi:MAG: hypothetical protein HOI53_00990 [Francisellaceae bacterium]|jgi:hypothetical protein|nr:hypothetical protein [Francisellaceae bacterium]MBT6206576.1 hypothetical protein [Francisellaceae bacterium]MBT6538635.1 hypothetical protein [Francisellaceae bacterium]
MILSSLPFISQNKRTDIATFYQLRSTITLAQAIASSRGQKVLLVSQGWKQIDLFNATNKITSIQVVKSKYKTSYVGFLSNNTINIDNNGLTYNNGTFYSNNFNRPVHVNKALRLTP